MSGFVSKYVVLQEHRVRSADFDENGVVRADMIEEWISAARTAYLDRCKVLAKMQRELGLVVHVETEAPDPARFGLPEKVIVSAGASELHPATITLAFRLRPLDGAGDAVINVTSVVALVDPATGEAHELGDEVRDELIALEHAAQHVN